MPLYRVAATFLVLAALVVGVILSLGTHHDPLIILQWALISAFVTYLCSLGIARFVIYKWLKATMSIVILAILGVLSVLQAPEQLERLGLATARRTPDHFAVALGVGGGAMALSQIISQFWKRPWLSNSFAITVLVFLNVYLFFAGL